MTEITLLDGSIGQELVKRSGDRATPLWSTQVMMDHGDLVRQVHDAYFAAGATVATTNTYAVLRDRLERVGLQDEVARLTENSHRRRAERPRRGRWRADRRCAGASGAVLQARGLPARRGGRGNLCRTCAPAGPACGSADPRNHGLGRSGRGRAARGGRAGGSGVAVGDGGRR